MNTTVSEKIDPMPAGTLGMWLFLASETMFFVGLLGAFIVLDSAGGQHQLFVDSSQLLSRGIGFIKLGLIVMSSLALLPHVPGRRRIAIFSAVCFLILQAQQWRVLQELNHGPSQNNFFACFFMLTIAHCVHVVAGIAAILWFTIISRSKLPDSVQIYWHFVNAVGVITFAALYFV